MKIYIIGITGVGKSSLGKKLARKLNYGFVDLDAWVEVRENASINQLFERGENYFRVCESKALKSLDHYDNMVIATGGGIVERDENMVHMRRSGYVIHLYRPIRHIVGAISTQRRPLLKDNPYALYDLYNARKHKYVKARHLKVDARSRGEAIKYMIREVKRYERSCNKWSQS